MVYVGHAFEYPHIYYGRPANIRPSIHRLAHNGGGGGGMEIHDPKKIPLSVMANISTIVNH